MKYKYIIDKMLYRILPEVVHQWGNRNKARARGVLFAIALTLAPLAVSVVPAEYQTEALAVGGALVALVQGESTHRVVSPWDGEDA